MTEFDAQVPLDQYNTFGLPGRARRYWRVTHTDALVSAARAGRLQGPRFVLGGGSNIVLRGDVDALVLHVALMGRACLEASDDHVLVAAAAGEPWHGFVRWTLAQGWPGLENLSLIPGTVGAAPVQNIGAYGLEVSERFDHLEAVDLDSGELRRFTRADCAFGYRDSVFKQTAAGRFLITRAVFRLPRPWVPVLGYADVQAWLSDQRIDTPSPEQISDAIIAIRQAKLPDPAQIGNAGSFFKNPVVPAAQARALLARFPAAPHYPQPDGQVKFAAGWLIDQCGWKGRALGPVACHDRQALVLVNRGGATGEDVVRIADRIADEVRGHFGVALEPEPLFV